MPGGTGRLDQSFVLRRVPGSGDYRARARIQANGSVRVGLARADSAGVQTVLGSEVTVPGLTYAAGTSLNVRAQAVGTAPTALRVKLWRTGTAEPTGWTVSVNDGAAGLQTAGSIGFFPYLASGTNNVPIAVRFDNLRAVTASTLA